MKTKSNMTVKESFVEKIWNKYQLYFFEKLLDENNIDKTVTCLLPVSGKIINEAQNLILQNMCDSVYPPMLLSEPISYYEEMEEINPKKFEELMKHYQLQLNK